MAETLFHSVPNNLPQMRPKILMAVYDKTYEILTVKFCNNLDFTFLSLEGKPIKPHRMLGLSNQTWRIYGQVS